jgi:hypothetical protein
MFYVSNIGLDGDPPDSPARDDRYHMVLTIEAMAMAIKVLENSGDNKTCISIAYTSIIVRSM